MLYIVSILKIITILAFVHVMRILLSEEHLVYNLSIVYEVISSPALNVLVFIRSFDFIPFVQQCWHLP